MSDFFSVSFKRNAILFNESYKMRVSKSSLYLCSMFILFIDILIYLKILKNIFGSMKLNTKIEKKIFYNFSSCEILIFQMVELHFFIFQIV